MGKVLIKPEVCMWCHLCEIWCVVAHSASKNLLKAFLHEHPKPLPRVIVEERLPVTFALQCRQCAEPDCVFTCISGALYREQDTGRIVHDKLKCIGCYSCVLACPYGCMLINEEQKEVFKCDACAGLEMPYCVLHCPNGALFIGAGGDGADG